MAMSLLLLIACFHFSFFFFVKLSNDVTANVLLIFRLAAKYDMRLVYKKGFHELFNEKNKDYGNLLHKMQALEVMGYKNMFILKTCKFIKDGAFKNT